MHACTLHTCPARDLAVDQSEAEIDDAARCVHVCEQCDQWDANGLVAIDTELGIINLDNQRTVVAVCHTCAATLLQRTN